MRLGRGVWGHLPRVSACWEWGEKLWRELGCWLLTVSHSSNLLLSANHPLSSTWWWLSSGNQVPLSTTLITHGGGVGEIRPGMSVVVAAEWGLLFTGVICWAGVGLRVTKKWGTQSYRQAHIIPGAGSRKQNPAGLPTAQLQQSLLVCNCIVNDATGERAGRGRCDF